MNSQRRLLYGLYFFSVLIGVSLAGYSLFVPDGARIFSQAQRQVDAWMKQIYSPPDVSEEMLQEWQVDSRWQIVDGGYLMVASSVSVVNKCKQNPDYEIRFPRVTNGIHEFDLDGKNIYRFGSIKDYTIAAVYFNPVLPCSTLQHGGKLTWRVLSTETKYKFANAPQVVQKGFHYKKFFDEIFNVLVGAALLVLAVVNLIVFRSNLLFKQFVSLQMGFLFLAFYFIPVSAYQLGIELNVLTAMRVVIFVGLWLGVLFIIYVLTELSLVKKFSFHLVAAFLVPASVIMMFSKNMDGMQLAVDLMFLPSLIFTTSAFASAVDRLRSSEIAPLKLAYPIGCTLFSLTASHDMIVAFFSLQSPMLFSIGALGIVIAISSMLKRNIQVLEDERNKYLAVVDVANQLVHDIRSPLMALSTGLKKIGKSGVDGTNLIKLANARINEIVNDLDSRRKLNSFVKQMTSYSFDLVRTIKEVLEEKNQILNDKKIKLEFSANGEFFIVTKISDSDLKRIISNILNNSIEATPGSGSVFITVSYVNRSDVVLQIADTGVGISKSDLERIGQKGYSVGKAYGSGIGLWWARQTLQAAGGRLAIDSVVGEGTTVQIYLSISS